MSAWPEETTRDARGRLEIGTVLFGGMPTLRETMPTWIQAVDGMNVTIRIVDNGPTREAEALLEQLSARTSVKVIYDHRPENPGFAFSANRLIKDADSPWLFLLNPDIYLDRTSIAKAIEYVSGASNPAAVSIRTRGKLTAGIALTWYGLFVDRQVPSRVQCLGPSGGAALIPVARFREAGFFFDEDLFAWGEDAGLAVRLFASGISTDCLNLSLEHVGGHSVASPHGQRLKARLLARNRLIVLRRDFTFSFQATVGFLMITVMLLNGLRKVRSGTGTAYFSGLLDAICMKRASTGTRSRMKLRQFIQYSATGRKMTAN